MNYKGMPGSIYILFISKTINSMGNFIFPLLTLIMTQKVGLNHEKSGFYLTVLSLLYAPGLILGGKLVDSIGRKKIIIIFHSAAAVAYLICSLIEPGMLLIYVVMLGSSLLAVSLPAYDALAADITTPNNRKRSYSLLYMGHNLGFAIAPVLGGMLYKKFLWIIFVGDALTAFISVFLIGVFIKEPVHKNTWNLGADKSEDNRQPNISLIKLFLGKRILLYFSLLLFCYNFAYSQWGFTMPLQLVELFGDKGSIYYGLLGGFNGMLIIVVTFILAKAANTMKGIYSIALGGLLYSVTFGLVAFISNIEMFFVAVGIMTIGEAMVSVNTSTFVANNSPVTHRGRINAAVPMIAGAGFTVGPLGMGRILRTYTMRQGWIFISLTVLFAGIIMFFLGRTYSEEK